MATVIERARVDIGVEHGAVGLLMAPGLLRLIRPFEVAQEIGETLAVFRRPELERGHRRELLAAIAVVGEGGVVDGEDVQRVEFVDQHRDRVAVEQQLERSLAPPDLGDVVMGGDPAAVGHGLNGD